MENKEYRLLIGPIIAIGILLFLWLNDYQRAENMTTEAKKLNLVCQEFNSLNPMVEKNGQVSAGKLSKQCSVSIDTQNPERFIKDQQSLYQEKPFCVLVNKLEQECR